MATLSRPFLSITQATGTNMVDVDAHVDVTFTPFELALMGFGLRGRLRCVLRGDDPFFDDDQFVFPTQLITTSGTKHFHIRLARSVLNEDPAPFDDDEIYAQFTLSSSEPTFPMNATARSATLSLG